MGEYIPQDIALLLCAAIRKENQRRWVGRAAWRCKLCFLMALGRPSRLRFSKVRGSFGCRDINIRYARMRERIRIMT
jgi:hypothetical protein